MKFINKDLYHTRGDSGAFTVSFRDLEKALQVGVEKGDKLTFTAKVNINTKDIVLQKTVEITEYLSQVEFKFKPEDTEDLKYGKYYWDVELETRDGEVLTLSKTDSEKPGKFILTGEVSH